MTAVFDPVSEKCFERFGENMPRRVLNDFSFSADVRIVCADVNFAKSLWEDLKGFQGLLGQTSPISG